MAASRPLVSIQNIDADGKETQQTSLPDVLVAPIRPDIVQFVHTSMAKNKRQPYAVFNKAGHQTAAESWGTGRAVSRIPRVPGGGTHRAGQAAFGNMCRGGRMFAPTHIWRRWHRKININQKRYAVVSALAASAVPALVLARGHRIENVPEIPLVLSDDAEGLEKTASAVKVLKKIGAFADVERVMDSRKLRPGKGKMRGRRYISKRGPLVVYGTEGAKLAKAFRNIPGIEVCSVDRLNLLQLAPGGHLGRFIIWTESAFQKLDKVFGSTKGESDVKKGYTLPKNIMTNPDVARLINSDEIQSIVKPPKRELRLRTLKRNPLKNKEAMEILNPHNLVVRKAQLEDESKKRKAKAEKTVEPRKRDTNTKKAGGAWFKTMISDSDYTEFDVFSKWLGNAQ